MGTRIFAWQENQRQAERLVLWGWARDGPQRGGVVWKPCPLLRGELEEEHGEVTVQGGMPCRLMVGGCREESGKVTAKRRRTRVP